MKNEKWLICGTRKKGYEEIVRKKLDDIMWYQRALVKDWKPSLIIEGCCPNSADVHAEVWAKENEVEIKHFPSHSGNYLKRNIEMVDELSDKDLVIAFWDGFSYGTAHTIALATMKNIPVVVFNLKQLMQVGGSV